MNPVRVIPRFALVLAGLVFACASSSPAADAPKAVGTWDAVSTTPNGDMPAVITIKQVEGALKAEIELDGEKRVVTDEKLEGDVFRMKVQYEGGVYDVEAKITGDALEGTWQGGGYSGTLKAKRVPDHFARPVPDRSRGCWKVRANGPTWAFEESLTALTRR
jgi:hypothetical protein